VGYVSINVGPDALASPELREILARRQGLTGLVFELTEHAAVIDYDAVARAVAEIRARGGRVAVDDAGSGISSFQHVLRLRPDIVKLDRWIIDHVDEDPARQALVRFLVSLADELDLQLVAEGIERPQERAACLSLGVTQGQGYLMGRPAALAGV
jgi:EAL domain-containing protein (putative c-di-GMP-specific phosphodiesterase class I)